MAYAIGQESGKLVFFPSFYSSSVASKLVQTDSLAGLQARPLLIRYTSCCGYLRGGSDSDSSGNEAEGDGKGGDGNRSSREERNSNSGLEFTLGNLAMGFDVYNDGARDAGVDDVVIEGAFKLSDPSALTLPRRGFTTLPTRDRP